MDGTTLHACSYKEVRAETRQDVQVRGAEYLTRSDLAALLEVHFETIKRWEREGKLPRPSRFGPKILRYDKRAIEKFLQDAAGMHKLATESIPDQSPSNQKAKAVASRKQPARRKFP
jgi:hypothetical protein